ncbi:MAG: energy transducer TonB [Acidobacteria bacterium]|nr:energy transducer TonB [Acidobacteriota bacterium]
MSRLAIVVASLVLSVSIDVRPQFHGYRKVTGIARSADGRPIAGMNLIVWQGKDNRVFLTNEKGEFVLDLENGDYEVTVNPVNAKDFRLVLSLKPAAPAPTELTLTFDPDRYCCSTADGLRYPEPVSVPRPAYPPAARAVHAGGEVIIQVSLREDGTVESANAIAAHPLLKAMSESAARGSKFSSLVAGESSTVFLTYVFMPDDTPKDVRRYANPYRIEVIPAPPVF